MPRAVPIFCLIMVLAGVCPAALAQPDYNSLLPRLKSAVAAFDGGKPATAVMHIEAILKARPSADTVLQVRDYLMTGAGGNKLIKMLSSGGELGRLIRYLLNRSEAVKLTPITSPERIQTLVNDFVEGEPVDKYRAMQSIQAKIGARAAPYFLAYLGERESIENRSSAILGLQKLGPVVVIPLIRALASKDKIQQQNCLLVLGNIGDARAAGAMRSIIGNDKYPLTVRSVARSAISKLEDIGPNPEGKSASSYFLEMAQKYYADDPAAMRDLGVDTLFWQWEKGKLVGQRIPPFLINELLAEEACYGALRADPNNAQAWQLLLLTYLSQHAEVADLAVAAKEKRAQISAGEQTLMARLRKLLWRIHSMTAIGGVKALDRALTQALSDRRGRVAEEAARFLGGVAPTGSAPPSALLQALKYPDRRVQYEAARALLRISPIRPFPQSAQAIQLVSRALGEKDARLVLIISDKPALSGAIAQALSGAGHLPVQVGSGAAGLDAARRYPLFDLIVLDTHLSDLAAFQVYETLKTDLRSKNMPILAVFDASDPAGRKANYDSQSVVGSAGVAAAAGKATSSAGGDYQGRARARAASAAAALAAIHPRNQVFKADAASAALTQALTRADSVRVPAARALARHGQSAALLSLVAVFSNKSASLAARLSAADAIGAICARNPGSGRQVAAALTAGLADGNPQIQQAAGQALGQAGRGPDAQRSALQQRQLTPSQKGQLK